MNKWIKIKELCESPHTVKWDSWKYDDFQYIDISSINRETKSISATTKMSIDDAPSRAKQLVTDKDILVSTVRPNLNAVAQVNLKDKNLVASTGFTVLRPNTQKIDSRYLFYFTQSKSFISHLMSLSTGASYPAVSDKIVKSTQIPLPPLKTQKRIVEILDAAQNLIDKRKEQIALMDQLIQSLFYDMFGDPVTNPMGWDIRKFGSITNGITDGAHFTPTYISTGIPFLRVTDIQQDQIDWDKVKRIPPSEHSELTKRCNTQKGDILLSKNGTIGKVKIVDWEQTFSTFVSLATIKTNHKETNVNYLAQYLKTDHALRQATKHSKTGTVTNLHLVEIRKMEIPVPPMEIQTEFSFRIDEAVKFKCELNIGYKELETNFNALMQSAFKGELIP